MLRRSLPEMVLWVSKGVVDISCWSSREKHANCSWIGVSRTPTSPRKSTYRDSSAVSSGLRSSSSMQSCPRNAFFARPRYVQQVDFAVFGRWAFVAIIEIEPDGSEFSIFAIRRSMRRSWLAETGVVVFREKISEPGANTNQAAASAECWAFHQQSGQSERISSTQSPKWGHTGQRHVFWGCCD